MFKVKVECTMPCVTCEVSRGNLQGAMAAATEAIIKEFEYLSTEEAKQAQAAIRFDVTFEP